MVVLDHVRLRPDSDGDSALSKHPITENAMFLDTVLIALNMPGVCVCHW